jgi:hypothetical protein
MSSTDPGAYCLERVGRKRAGWDTLVVSGAADTALSPEDLWTVWSDLVHWPLWSPLHQWVTRTGSGALAAGAVFDQRISLGFPVGTTTEHVTLAELEPARRAVWAGEGNGIRSCHQWRFTPLPGGGTRLSNTEAFAGPPVALIRPFVTRRWNRAFQAGADGLIRHTASRTEASR